MSMTRIPDSGPDIKPPILRRAAVLASADRTRMENSAVTAALHPDDLAGVRRWFRRLYECVQAVDYEGARPLFAEDMVAFGTFENFITGRERVEQAQWRNVWGVTSGFHFRDEDIRAIVSA